MRSAGNQNAAGTTDKSARKPIELMIALDMFQDIHNSQKVKFW